MNRPWPVSAISILNCLTCLSGAWGGWKGERQQFILVPIYLVLAIGLWRMKEWARRGTLIVNGLFGTLGAMFWIYIVVFAVVRLVQLPHPWPGQFMQVISVKLLTFLGVLILMWAPFVYLRRPSVKQLFKDPSLPGAETI